MGQYAPLILKSSFIVVKRRLQECTYRNDRNNKRIKKYTFCFSDKIK